MGLLGRMSTPPRVPKEKISAAGPPVIERNPRSSEYNSDNNSQAIIRPIPKNEDNEYYKLAKKFFNDLKELNWLKEDVVDYPTQFLMTLTQWIKKYINNEVHYTTLNNSIKEHFIKPEFYNAFDEKYGYNNSGGRRRNKRTLKRKRQSKRKYTRKN